MSLHIPHYLDTGAGPPLVLLHAFPLDHSMWDSQLPGLAGARLVRPDAPGFGFSPEAPWRIADYARSVVAMADSLGLSNFALAGLSMGGYTAFEIYRQAPDRVGALILANTRARSDTAQERQGRMDLKAAIRQDGISTFQDRIIPRLVGGQPDPGLVASLRSMIARVPPPVLVQALEALGERNDSTDLLEKIRCPVLVIAGTQDAITGVTEAREWSGRIPNARFLAIPHAGHLTNMENPAAFNAAVAGFLEEVDADPASDA